MKNDCDIIQDAQDQVNASLHEEDIANEQMVDDNIEKSSRLGKFIDKWFREGNQEIPRKELDKYFGSLSERERLAEKIELLLKSNPDLSETIIEEIKFRLATTDSELPASIISKDAKLVFKEFPLPMLRSYYRFTEGWINSNGKDWDNFYYRNIRIPFGLPKKLRFEEPTGAYNDVFLATQRYADSQGIHIKRFNHGKAETDRGMNDVLEDVEGTYRALEGSDALKEWLKGGFLKGRTETKGKANLVRIFTDMMRGRIINVSFAESKNMIENKETGKKELQWKDGPGLYIYQHWAPTGDKYKSTGDAVFRWQKPVKFKYNEKLHSEMRDHKGDLRHDTMEYIKNSIPLDDAAIQRLSALQAEARKIDNEFYDYVAGKEIKDNKGRVIAKTEGQLAKSFNNIIDAVMMHFPNKNKAQLKDVFEDKSFDSSWSEDEKQTFKYLEERFTQYSLSSPFLYEGIALDKKDDHFPYMFMPETFVIMLSETINQLESEIKELKGDVKGIEGSAVLDIEDKIDGLESSVRHMKELKESMLNAPEDVMTGGQMVARTNSKYFKHISNAFDMLKARTDKNVYLNYLEHNARSIERNNLTAELIKSLAKTEDSPVQEAMINLYKRTIGRMDTRSTFFGMNISDENLNPKIVRALRALRKWDTLMLASPVTAIRNYMGHIEKYNKTGYNRAADAFKYIEDFGDNEGLKNMVADSGVNVFDEFFTHAIVKDLEENEIERENIQNIVNSFVKYYTGSQNDKARNQLRKDLRKYYGKAMKQNAEFLLTPEEAKAFSKKMKQEKLQRFTNKIVNLAIANEYRMNEALKNQRNIIGSLKWSKKKASQIAEGLVRLRGTKVKGAFVMTEAEKHLRVTSFVLGVQGAQKYGLVGPGRVHELTGQDRINAIKYGRYATNFVFDFGMSKQHIGEIAGSSLGQFLGQFTVWRAQKGSSDLDLFKRAAEHMSSNNTPVAVMQAMSQALNFMKHPASKLQQTAPDVLTLRRFLYGQFMIEGLMSAIFLAGSVLPNGIKHLARATGARKASSAGSDVAAWFWMPVMLILQAALGDDDDDLEKAEQSFSYMLRKIPVAGLGVGLVYDMTALLIALIAEEEEIVEDKILQGTNYALPIPLPAVREIKKTALEAIKD